MERSLRWWFAPALLLAALYLFMAGQNLVTTDPPRPWDAVALAALAGLLVAGLVIRQRRRPVGTALLTVGALPGLAAWWTILAPLAAVALIAGVVTDRGPRTISP